MTRSEKSFWFPTRAYLTSVALQFEIDVRMHRIQDFCKNLLLVFELYDLKKDPNQFENLANQTEHQKVIDELKSNIPKEPKWKYFMRFNDYKILVPEDKSSSIKIFDQASLGKVDVDVATENPLIVQQIKAYIKKHSLTNNKLIVNLKNGRFPLGIHTKTLGCYRNPYRSIAFPSFGNP